MASGIKNLTCVALAALAFAAAIGGWACEHKGAVDKAVQRQELDAYLAGFEKLWVELQASMTAALKAQHEFKGPPEDRAVLTTRNEQVLATMRDLTRRLEALDAPNPRLRRLRETHQRMFEATITAFTKSAKAWKTEDQAELTRCLDEFDEVLEGEVAKAARQAGWQLAAYRDSLR